MAICRLDRQNSGATRQGAYVTENFFNLADYYNLDKYPAELFAGKTAVEPHDYKLVMNEVVRPIISQMLEQVTVKSHTLATRGIAA